MSKYTRTPDEVIRCGRALQARLTALKKVLVKRKSPITFELEIELPADDRRVYNPCPPCADGITNERVLAELFVALWKALRMKAPPGPRPKRRPR